MALLTLASFFIEYGIGLSSTQQLKEKGTKQDFPTFQLTMGVRMLCKV